MISNLHNLELYNFFKNDQLLKNKKNGYEAVLLRGNEIVYDSSGHGLPLFIPARVLKMAKYPSKIQIFLDHNDDVRNLVGYADNIQYKNERGLVCNLHFYDTSLGKDIETLIKTNAVQDLSVKMLTEEHFDYQRKMNIVDKIKKLINASIVLEGASEFAYIKS